MAILKLQPLGLSEIVFGTISLESSTSGYYVPASDNGSVIEFNEGTRIDIIYSNLPNGGRAISTKKNLVPVTFSCIVSGTTRQVLLAKVHTLVKAISNNVGGKLEYRPDGADISTFYIYEKSKSPDLTQTAINHYDTHIEGGGSYVLALDIELMTHPVAISEATTVVPDNTTIYNTIDGLNVNYFDLSNTKGDLPAFLNLEFTSAAPLNRVYIGTRSTKYSNPLSEINQSISAEDYATADAGWSIETDGSREGGQVARCTPATADTWTVANYTINNEDMHRGRIAVLAVVKATSASNWKFRLSLSNGLGKYWISNSIYSPEIDSKWHLIYLGDIDIPGYFLPDNIIVENNIRLGIEAKAITAGGSSIDIDLIYLMFQDETIQQIDLYNSRTYGLLSSSYKYYTEVNNMGLRVAQIIHTNATDTVVGISNVYGSLALEVDETTRFYFAFERKTTESVPHTIDDTIDVTCKLIYRTIFPFGA